MLKKRFRAGFYVLALIVFAFMLAVPMQARAVSLSYGDWEIDGFARNTTAVWTQSFDYAPNNDPLAMCRNTFRLNLNGKISDALRLKAEVSAAWEPEYDREENNGGTIPANYYNQFDFREMRLDWRPAQGHNIRFGKQIVNWGEAVTGRVGDVVNSTDARWDLGFTNLEDTRTPTWMIRGIHQIYSIGTSFDWIVAPYLEVDRWRTSRTLAWNALMLSSNGTNNGALYNGLGTQRFSLYPEDRIIIPGKGQVNNAFGGALAGAPILFPAFQQVIYGPMFYGPTYAPAGYSGQYVQTYPKSNWKDTRFGFKTSSTVMGAQTGVYFFKSNFSAWSTTTTKYDPVTGDLIGVWDRINYYGIYANKNYDFGVLRADICYAPKYKVTALDLRKYPTMEGEIDKLKVQVGYNKDFMIRALNPDQTFGLIAEYIGEFVTGGDARGDALWTWVSHEEMPDALSQIALSLSTNYNFGMYAPGLTLIWNDNNCGLAQASFTYTPDWMNRKWSFKLQYTNVFSDDQYDFVYGMLNEKDMIGLQTQFNFP